MSTFPISTWRKALKRQRGEEWKRECEGNCKRLKKKIDRHTAFLLIDFAFDGCTTDGGWVLFWVWDWWRMDKKIILREWWMMLGCRLYSAEMSMASMVTTVWCVSYARHSSSVEPAKMLGWLFVVMSWVVLSKKRFYLFNTTTKLMIFVLVLKLFLSTRKVEL